MPAPRRPHPHQRGLGWAHRQQREVLLRRHVDGSPCPCTDCGPGCPCRAAGFPKGAGLPMWKDATLNVDGQPLEADHSLARSQGGTVADRLMLSTCNRSRGDGLRAAGRGQTLEASREQRRPYWSREWF